MSATITVGVGTGYDYAHIQEAVDHAQDGDTIMVAGGVYAEQVLITGKTGITIEAVADATVEIVAPADVINTATSSSSRFLDGVVTVVDSNNVQLVDVKIN